MRLDNLAGYADLELNIKTSDLCITDIETAICYLSNYLDGEYFTKKQLRDSLKYIERYVDAVNNETYELNEMFNKLF